jgi:hypothetical protein
MRRSAAGGFVHSSCVVSVLWTAEPAVLFLTPPAALADRPHRLQPGSVQWRGHRIERLVSFLKSRVRVRSRHR